MDIFSKIMDVFSGGAVGTIVDAVKTYFPPSMTEQEKAALSVALSNAEIEKMKAVALIANDADKEFNSRIKEMEGTATDLKSIPLIGALMLFIRGAQRPIFGYATIFLDFKVFAGEWKLPDGSQQAAAFYIINLLVLGFLFGERAVQNVAPYLTQFFGPKK